MDGDWRPCPWFSLSIRAGFLFQKQRVFSLFREVLLLWDVLKINTHCSMKNILFSSTKIFYRIKKIFNVYLKIYIFTEYFGGEQQYGDLKQNLTTGGQNNFLCYRRGMITKGVNKISSRAIFGEGLCVNTSPTGVLVFVEILL